MSRSLIATSLLALSLCLAGCQSGEPDADAGKSAAAPAELKAPVNGEDNNAWKTYLGQVVGQHMNGVTDRVFPYYLPNDSTTPAPGDQDGMSQYDRQLENVSGVLARTVLPGNMLAFGSPDSAKMANLVVAAFADAKPDAMKGSQVLFIGAAIDSGRVQAAVEAAGAKYTFVEAK